VFAEETPQVWECWSVSILCAGLKPIQKIATMPTTRGLPAHDDLLATA